ncbi:MAG: hypothetical protein II399_00770, partial [Lachnospiraceae bacterium]|nr:hypothetical protein [Lachnospiraceae bacterium]
FHFEGSENESMSFYEYYECDETFYVLSGAFPELDNLEPNGDGLYPHGNEEYVMLEGSDGRQKYLELGTERRGSMTEDEYQAGISELKSQGAWYDAGSNTLYLNNFSTDDLLDVNWMGNGFKINVTGDCTLGGIRVWGWYYGGSVLITGTGTLTLNPDSSNAFGIVLEAEESNSCLMLDANVTVIINGKQAAIQAHATLADTPFYAKSVPNVSVRTYIDKSTDKHDAYLTKSGEDEPIKHIEFTPRSY